jgi:hypothetical protein
MQIGPRIVISVFVIVTLFASTRHLLAGDDPPEILVDAFFSQAGIADKAAMYTGEMLERFADRPTLGQSLKEGVTVTRRLLEKKLSRAVYAVEVSRADTVIDWYVFLREEHHVWKLEAVRSLALMGPIHYEIQRLGQNQHRSAELERQYQNFVLTVASDQQLKAYLRTNHKHLQELVDLALAGKVAEATAMAKARSLHLVELLPDDKKIVQIVVGGILDNTIGFMQVPQGAVVPSMDPSEYIYIEHVIDNWYIYKTT